MADALKQNTHGYDQDNLRHVVITATCFAFILSTFAVAFRLISRGIIGSGLFLDDWLIILALIFEYGISIGGIVLLYNGLGVHAIELTAEQTVVYLKTLFTGSILYTGCILFIKLSILALYRRLFPIKSMKIAVNTTALIVILWAACGILSGCFVCIPTEKLWHPMMEGGCMSLGKFYYGLQIPNILTDAIILVMPMYVVWKLPISKAQKLGLSGIFVLGFLTLIFDIIRLLALIELSRKGDDITYDQVPASVWTCIEPAVGILAACLSNMRPLFKSIQAKVGSTFSSHTASQSMAKGSQGSQSSDEQEIQSHTSSDHRTENPEMSHC